jgi:hypothetical protein
MDQNDLMLVPPKKMIITTTGGLYPPMEIEVTRPAFRVPKESETNDSEESLSKPIPKKDQVKRINN